MINRPDLFVDSAGFVMVRNEPCRFCGRDSKELHPAGVVAGKWFCSTCEKFQNETRQEVGK